MTLATLLLATLPATTGDYMLATDRPTEADRLPAAMPTAPYDDAYARAMKSGKRLVVMVTASWCPPCRQAKRLVAEVENKGVEFAMVDYDGERQLAKKLMNGKQGIPLVVVYELTGGRWRVRRYVGVQSREFYRKLFADEVKR